MKKPVIIFLRRDLDKKGDEVVIGLAEKFYSEEARKHYYEGWTYEGEHFRVWEDEIDEIWL